MSQPPSPDGTIDGTTAALSFGPDDRPVGIADVELAVFEGEAVLFDVQASMVHHLNAVAGATWLCCDGETSVAQMIDELADIFSITDRAELDGLAESVRNSLEQLAAQGLLSDRPVPGQLRMTPQPVLADDGTEILPAPPDP